MSLKFPKSFKFGVADADLQVVGEGFTRKFEDSEVSSWDYFAKHSGVVYQNQPPGAGSDRYNKWPEDVELMKKMGVKHYRTSVSMCRTLKKDSTINEKAIAWYKNFFQALNQAGIKVYITLYHWELPHHLAKEGGWKVRKTVDYFVRHAEITHKYLDPYIEEYFILNEPWCSSILGYYYGANAPGERNLKNALLVAHNLLLAQGLVYKKLIAKNPKLKIGTVFNTEPSYADTEDEKDILAAKYADGFFNRWFMDPLFIGEYPEDMLKLYGENVPKFTKEEMGIIKIGDKLHTFGVNYYRGNTVRYDAKSDLKFAGYITKKGCLRNDLDWDIYVPPFFQEGLYDVLSQIYYSYKQFGLKKMYITENGMAQNTPWDGKSSVVNDDRRVYYLREHIRQIHKALTRGIPIEGYFEWTLMDNYEWARGYVPKGCFGIIHVDRKTMKRVWKKSAHWYKQLVDTHILPE
ncbi:family 1 glycosylhydrolase [Candidatus Daviesbacteria bacterium]|nr:family 1 glycosylhydrolase [Candidatus Daviesbacteria bacterium]